MPDDATLRMFYESAGYFTGRESAIGYSDYDSQTDSVIPFFRGVLDRLGSGNGRSVLDIGCAYGTHLALAAKAGWECYGVEVSEFARHVMIERYGKAVPVVATISELPSRHWDLILLLDVIEHLRDPYQLFIDLVDKGGISADTVVVITTPNARSLAATHDPAGWEYRTPPEHLLYFSSESLLLFLTALGFGHVDVSGSYRIAEGEASADAREEIDGFMAPYAGLSCEASGFQVTSSPFAKRIQIERDRNRETARLRQSSPFLSGLFHAVARQSDLWHTAHSAKLEAQRAEVQAAAAALDARSAEFEAFQQDRLYRLIHTLRSRQPPGEKLRRVSWILGSMLVPTSIKRRVLPVLKDGQSGAETATMSDAPEPYVVRRPIPVRQDRLRVVHAIGNFMTGGSSRLVVDLIEHLGGEYEQEVITSFVPSPPAYVGLPIREFRRVNSLKPLLAYLSKFRPQLMHVHFWGDVDLSWYRQVFEAGRRHGCKIIENINTPVTPFVADSVSRYVYVSDYVRREFGRSGPNGQVIHPGSNLELFSRASDVRPTDDCIGMVYRLEPDKLSERSIDVFIQSVRRRPATRVLIVGGGSLHAGFQRTVSEAGLDVAFEFTGQVRYEDLPAMYRRMSVFVAPVWQESFGQVSSFAMSMALPVVGYDVGALAEIIADRELLAPSGHSEALAGIIVDLLDDRDRRVEIGRKNQRRAHEMFSVDSMIDHYRQLYGELTRTSP